MCGFAFGQIRRQINHGRQKPEILPMHRSLLLQGRDPNITVSLSPTCMDDDQCSLCIRRVLEEYGWIILCGIVAFGWFVAMQLYKRSAKIKGF